jgi:hypothetical protein
LGGPHGRVAAGDRPETPTSHDDLRTGEIRLVSRERDQVACVPFSAALPLPTRADL